MLETAPSHAATQVSGAVAAGIVGLGSALPETRITSAELEAHLGVGEGWIERRTGIRERRELQDGERLDDLAARAAQAALDDAGVDVADIDLVVVATLTTDDLTPGAAPLVAARLGSHAAAIDVNGACVGFLHALDLAAGTIGAGRARNVLVIGAEALRRFVDRDDRRTAGLFGDGAGAAVLAAGPGLVAPFVLRSAGEHADLIRATRAEPLIRMQGHETFLLATQALSEAALAACERAEVELERIDRFVFHQANRRILEAVTERLAVDPARVTDAIADLGNTSAASVPLALDHARPQPGERVLLGAMGAGFVYGAGVLTWP